MDFSHLNDRERMQMQSIVEQRQMKDFMRLYGNLVDRCFLDCVNDFTSKVVSEKEATCLSRCTDKFMKHSERVGGRTLLNFPSHRGMNKLSSLWQNEDIIVPTTSNTLLARDLWTTDPIDKILSTPFHPAPLSDLELPSLSSSMQTQSSIPTSSTSRLFDATWTSHIHTTSSNHHDALRPEISNALDSTLLPRLESDTVFGFGGFEDTFISDQDLACAAAKLDEDEAKTSEDQLLQNLNKLMSWRVDDSIPVGPDVVNDVSLCINFVVVGVGRFQMDMDAASWEGTLQSINAPMPASSNTCLRIPPNVMSNVRCKTLSDEGPMILVTLDDTLFIQFCFKSGSADSGQSCAEAINRLIRGKDPRHTGGGLVTHSRSKAENQPYSRTPTHPRATAFDHLRLTRTTIKSYSSSNAFLPQRKVSPVNETVVSIEDLEEEFRMRVDGATARRDARIKLAQEEFEMEKNQLRQEIDSRIHQRRQRLSSCVSSDGGHAEITNSEDTVEEGPECKLCYDSFESKELLPCRHRICSSCYGRLDTKKCPWDRSDIDNVIDIPQ
ncbi:hypothetical protein SeMB42_g05679 [Synchytrium endobioticum]|uniref:Mitochondrial import inner membrane translocase subunit TIM9 n=1 Tax=Synchytrium endobioticum TaxID=286115 RepID=A0A507CRT3_9FUNG|nr:hypothetical protein SeMB42_g05679 [Synchytrium endobioticum]TPX41864.1 hypothetical protein SeLEV6574_g05887 [Synchytrium endobioticum]